MASLFVPGTLDSDQVFRLIGQKVPAALRLSLDELLLSLRRKRIPIQFEIGTFIVLETCETVFDSPLRVDCSDISIDDEGRVLIGESASEATAEESARALIDILCELLLASAPGIPDSLLRLVEHGPSDDRYTLIQLKDDLEAALVPLNRSATRRVIARLVREAMQQGERQAAKPDFTDSRAELDDEFDALFGRSKIASPSSSSAVIDPGEILHSDSAKNDSDSYRDHSMRSKAGLQRDDFYESDQSVQTARATAPRVSERDKRQTTDRPFDHTDDFIDIQEQTKEKNPTVARLSFAVIAIALLVVGYFVFSGQDNDDSRTSTKIEGLSANTVVETKTAQETRPLEKAPPSKGVLRVNSTPSFAQVMLYIGRGLAHVERVPQGVAHEFVAIADGFTPLRTVLDADTKWQLKDGVPFTTLTMTLARKKAQSSTAVLGATRLPRQKTVPNGKVGTVEIRTKPPDAAIYQLIGFTPDMAIESLATDKPVRLLLYAAGYRVEHVDIDPTQWVEREGTLSATVDAKLNPLAEIIQR